MNERDEVLLRDMLDFAYKSQKFIKNRTRADLDTDDMFALALTRAVEIIGEAANHVSIETRNTLSDIQWKNIIGMRNILIHDYTSVDHNILWGAATNSVPELIIQLEAFLPPEHPE